MKHHHTSNCPSRMLAKSWRYGLGVVLITLISFSLSIVRPAAGQTPARAGTLDFPAGLDLFETDPAITHFKFDKEFTIPAGFFDQDSKPFAGTVAFKGVPIGSFRGQPTGAADTIVERKTGVSLSASHASAKILIEVVALSVESVEPIRVQVGQAWQLWKVKVELSPSRRSEGTMKIKRVDENGGTFDSEFAVFALFTFTRQGDGTATPIKVAYAPQSAINVRQLDVGAQKLSSKSICRLTLTARKVPCQRVPNCSCIANKVTEHGIVVEHGIVCKCV